MLVQDTKSTLEIMTVIERAVLYARVSGDDRGKEGRNLKSQLEMSRDYAKQKDYRIIAELSEDDKGVSGYEIDLPQLNQVRNMAHNKEFDVLIVRELDRLSRNLAKQLIVEEELNRAGVRVEYVLADYDDTPEGRLNKHIRATIAEYEREKIIERMNRGKRLAAQNGNMLMAGMPPFGYKKVEMDNQTFVEINEEEATTVRLIFDWFVQGQSLGWICSTLEDMGVGSFSDVRTNGHRVGKHKKGSWAKNVISRILANETYIGNWYYGKYDGRAKKANPRSKWIRIPVPPIITQDTWGIVQDRLAYNKEKFRRNLRHDYLLRRRLVCGNCGKKFQCRSSHKKPDGNSRYQYYVCKCNSIWYRASEFDTAVWAWIKSLLSDADTLTQTLRKYREGQKERLAPYERQLEITEDLIASNKQKLERLLDLYVEGSYSKEMLLDHKANLEKTITSLEDEKSKIIKQISSQRLTDVQINGFQEFAQKVVQQLKQADERFETKERLVELLELEAKLVVEETRKVIHVSCIVKEDVLQFESHQP